MAGSQQACAPTVICKPTPSHSQRTGTRNSDKCTDKGTNKDPVNKEEHPQSPTRPNTGRHENLMGVESWVKARRLRKVADKAAPAECSPLLSQQ